MRIQYLFIAMLTLLFLSQPSFAATPQEDVTSEEEEVLPDAMSRIIKAPDIDLEKIRDPFLSSFEKKRLEEAGRLKKREQSLTSTRKQEPLEFFDLSTLTLVAIFKKQGKEWVASVQDNTGKAYTVRRGNYMGKNGGRIEKIDGQTVYLVEQMVDPSGEVIDHQVTLTLAEVNDEL